MKPEFFYNFGVFMVKVPMKLDVCLSGLHGIHLSLRRLVVFLDIHFISHVHFILGHIMLLFGFICVILLSIMLVYVLIMHTVRILICLYLLT